jgi:hypothetical protein
VKKNISTLDRIIRLMIAAVVAILFFNNMLEGTKGIVLMLSAGAILITSVINFCPIYYVLGISTSGEAA